MADAGEGEFDLAFELGVAYEVGFDLEGREVDRESGCTPTGGQCGAGTLGRRREIGLRRN